MADKERLIGAPEVGVKEVVKKESVMVDREILGREPVPKEVKNWLEDLEQQEDDQQTVSDPKTQKPILIPTDKHDVYILPVDRQTFVGGFKKKYDDVLRWLSTYLFREIKINRNKKIEFKEKNDQ